MFFLFEELNRPKLGEVKIIIHGLEKIINCEMNLMHVTTYMIYYPHSFPIHIIFMEMGLGTSLTQIFGGLVPMGSQVLGPSSVEVNMCNLNR